MLKIFSQELRLQQQQVTKALIFQFKIKSLLKLGWEQLSEFNNELKRLTMAETLRVKTTSDSSVFKFLRLKMDWANKTNGTS